MINHNLAEKTNRRKFSLAAYGQFFLALALWCAYLVVFFWFKASITPKHFIHTPLDDLIPFVKWFFPVYCSWFLYMALPLLYFYFAARKDFMKLQYYIFTGFFLCVAFYVIYPNAIDFRPVVTGGDLISRAMRAMYSIDTPTMVMPSMHVFASVAIHLGLTKSEKTCGKKGLLRFSFILMILICASTVLVKQHSVIDVFWGVLLALALYFPFYGRRKKQRGH